MIKSTSKTLTIDQIYPLLHINSNGYSVLSRRGVMTYGWEVTYPQAFSLQEPDYDMLFTALLSACKSLPSWSILHRQDRYFREVFHADKQAADRSFLSEGYENHFDGRNGMIHHSYIFISAATKDITMGSKSGLTGLRRVPIKVQQENIQDFEAKCEEFSFALQNAGITMRPLTASDWVGSKEAHTGGIVQDYLQLGNDDGILSDLALGDDFISTERRTAVVYKINEGSQLPNIMFTSTPVKELSTAKDEIHLSYAASLGLLLDCDHIVNQIIVIPSAAAINKYLEDKKKRMLANFASNDNRLNATQIAEYQDYAYINSVPTIYSHTNIIGISERDNERDVSNRISAALKSMDITATYCRQLAPVIWYAGCPGCASDLNRKLMMTQNVDAALALGIMESFPSSFSSQEGLSPTFQITDRFRHIPIWLDAQMLAQSHGMIGGYNAFTIGGTGSGKSFFTNSYLRQLYDAGQDVFIIDVGDSYEVLCSLIHEESGGRDGHYMRFSQEHPLHFNLFPDFEAWFNKEGEVERTEAALDCLLTFLKSVWTPRGGWTERLGNILAYIVDLFLLKCHKDGITPVFNDLYTFFRESIAPSIRYDSPYSQPRPGETIEELVHRRSLAQADIEQNAFHYAGSPVTSDIFDIDDFLQSVSSYAEGGRFGFLLNSRDADDLFSSRFVVFEVDKLRDIDKNGSFFSVCILFIMNAFDRKMRKDRAHFKNLVIEEAWTAIANETMAPYIKYLYKTARKFSASINTVTQEVEDILSSEIIKNTIFQNSDIKYILDQSKNNRFEELAQMLDLNSRERALVRTLNRIPNPLSPHSKDVFIKIGPEYSGVFTTEVSRREALAYESNKEKKAPLLEKAAECGSFVQAIKILAGEITIK